MLYPSTSSTRTLQCNYNRETLRRRCSPALQPLHHLVAVVSHLPAIVPAIQSVHQDSPSSMPAVSNTTRHGSALAILSRTSTARQCSHRVMLSARSESKTHPKTCPPPRQQNLALTLVDHISLTAARESHASPILPPSSERTSPMQEIRQTPQICLPCHLSLGHPDQVPDIFPEQLPDPAMRLHHLVPRQPIPSPAPSLSTPITRFCYTLRLLCPSHTRLFPEYCPLLSFCPSPRELSK